jgi:hypothetical protein
MPSRFSFSRRERSECAESTRPAALGPDAVPSPRSGAPAGMKRGGRMSRVTSPRD